jgi:hypothetical protein
MSTDPKPPSTWPWFVAGFLVVFLVLALAWPMRFHHGSDFEQLPLWRFYILEYQEHAISLSLAHIATEHLLFSAIAGISCMAVAGMMFRKGAPKSDGDDPPNP